MPARARRLSFFLVLALAAFTGCDTDDPGSIAEELEGEYAITRLYFDPTAAGIQDADVAARLDAALSSVRLFGTGQALVEYKLDNQPSALVNGTFTATSTTARLSATTTADAERLASLLLPQSFTLSRSDDDVLSATLSVTANLEAFDAATYPGLTSVGGTLDVRLERQP